MEQGGDALEEQEALAKERDLEEREGRGRGRGGCLQSCEEDNLENGVGYEDECYGSAFPARTQGHEKGNYYIRIRENRS